VIAQHPSGDMDQCIINLEVFEGPLDLLLHLIKKHEIDIFDIPISFITDKYLEYLASMQELQLDIAVEYLEMAATLAHIKSQMLLPEEPREEDEEEQPDPREELVRRLLEYKKYKEAARALSQKFMLGRDIFTGEADVPEPEARVISDVSVFDLLDVAASLIAKARERGKEGPELLADRITVAERIGQISDILQQKEKITFQALFEEDYSVFDVVITFLAILEMVRLHMLSVVQDESHGEILIILPVTYEKRVEEERKPEIASGQEREEKKSEEPDEGKAEPPGRQEEAADGKETAEQETKPPGSDMAGELSDLLDEFLNDKEKE
jgi:segregation and condensation protein A